MSSFLKTLDSTRVNTVFTNLTRKAEVEIFLNTQGPFTVFAPNDEAFTELPEDILSSLEDKERLRKFIDRHIVQGEINTDDLAQTPSLETLSGKEILIDNFNDTVVINDASVVQPDIGFDGGLIHIIDGVLIP